MDFRPKQQERSHADEEIAQMQKATFPFGSPGASVKVLVTSANGNSIR